MRAEAALAVACLVLLCGCGSPAAVPPSPATASSAGRAAGRTQVAWEDYGRSMKAEIDERTGEQDCAGLRSMFAASAEINDGTEAREGHGNVALLAYLTEALELAGCQ